MKKLKMARFEQGFLEIAVNPDRVAYVEPHPHSEDISPRQSSICFSGAPGDNVVVDGSVADVAAALEAVPMTKCNPQSTLSNQRRISK